MNQAPEKGGEKKKVPGKGYMPSKMDKNKRFRDYYEKVV